MFGKMKELQNRVLLMESNQKLHYSELQRLNTLLEFFTLKRKSTKYAKQDIVEEFDHDLFENIPAPPASAPAAAPTAAAPPPTASIPLPLPPWEVITVPPPVPPNAKIGEILISEEYARKIDDLSNIDFAARVDVTNMGNDLKSHMEDVLKAYMDNILPKALNQFISQILNTAK